MGINGYSKNKKYGNYTKKQRFEKRFVAEAQVTHRLFNSQPQRNPYCRKHNEMRRMERNLIQICFQVDTVISARHGGVPWRDRFKSVLKTYKEPSGYAIKPRR